MPNIWNINGNQNIANKRISSKLTFNVGERFVGKIIKRDGESSVRIKLSDGWQFSAEIDGEVDLSEQNTFRFEVKDFGDGKLKLRIVKEEKIEGNNIVKDENLHRIIKEKGLSLRDLPLLKEMIKREIQLTKENVEKFKEILFYNKELKGSNETINKFIESYMVSKGIFGEEGEKTKEALRGFIDKFVKMNREEVLFFLENNIELEEKNIDSFNRMFKEEGGFSKFYGQLKGEVEKVVLSGDVIKAKGILKEIEKIKEENRREITPKEGNRNTKPIYGEGQNTKVMSILKSIVGGDEERISTLLKDVAIKSCENLEGVKVNNGIEIVESLTINKFKSLLEEQFKEMEKSEGHGEKGVYSKENIEKTLEKLTGIKFSFTEEEIKEIVEIFKEFDGIDRAEKQLPKAKLNDVLERGILENKGVIAREMRAQTKALGEISKVLKGGEEIFFSDKISQFIKENISNIKLLNAINNEYYYLDLPVKINREEYPCKLVIKDKRSDSKKIDKNNIKVVVNIKTINLDTVDGYINMKNGNINVILKCREEFVDILSIGVENLKKTLGTIAFNIKVSVEKKEAEFNIATCRSFFEGEENRTIDRMV